MKVGFIGVGNMGSGMAANLLKAGHEVSVYNRTAEKIGPLKELGAIAAARVEQACGGEAVITMLSDDSALETISFGAEGIIGSLSPGAIHISMSTISVALSERLAGSHAKASQRFLAAPVFGRPDAAAAGRLFIACAGLPDAVEESMPLLEAMGRKVFIFGEKPQTANLIKLSGNFLIASVIESLGEAMALVEKAGVDPGLYVDFLTSTLFGAPVYNTYGHLIAEKKFEPAGFAAPLGHKDIRLAMEAADSLRVPMPLASLIHDRFLALLAQGGQKLDWSAIAWLAARDSGVLGPAR
ncbi:MAG: NAD(P)-dependent oxidoreductase [Syntrophobacteraceae bacterium]|nr:NAD(P)-dependent oxidoreductase [Syntrophobacteraceae bacterium]